MVELPWDEWAELRQWRREELLSSWCPWRREKLLRLELLLVLWLQLQRLHPLEQRCHHRWRQWLR